MLWWLKEPRHQQVEYRPNKPEYSVSDIRRVDNHVCITTTMAQAVCNILDFHHNITLQFNIIWPDVLYSNETYHIQPTQAHYGIYQEWFKKRDTCTLNHKIFYCNKWFLYFYSTKGNNFNSVHLVYRLKIFLLGRILNEYHSFIFWQIIIDWWKWLGPE